MAAGTRGWPPAARAEPGPIDPGPGNFTAGPVQMAVVDSTDVAAVDLLVDARAPERYAGEHEPVDPVAGHIPGAVDVPTADNLAPDGRFKTADELRRTYAAVGAVAGADVAAYCGSGVTACHDVLALAAARVPAALYAGSFSEWVSDPGSAGDDRPALTSLLRGQPAVAVDDELAHLLPVDVRRAPGRRRRGPSAPGRSASSDRRHRLELLGGGPEGQHDVWPALPTASQ